MSHSPSESTSSLHPTSPHPSVYPQFILLGDSITQLSTLTLTARLAEWYSRRLDVINRGFSGYTAPMGHEVLQRFLPADSVPSQMVPRVRLMTIFFGANDACVPGHPQHVPLQRYISSLRDMISHPALKLHDTQVILITPPPVDEYQLGGRDRTAEHTAKYARAALQIGQDCGLPVLDLWTIFMRRAGWTEGSTDALAGSKDAPRSEVLGDLLIDGLHLTAKGYDVVFYELVKVIEQELPGQMPQRLPMVFPDWKDKLGVQ
ncbi:Isoamyl acetate-hydrolyzing esterase 1 like protein [Cladophialophora carrionii]|uniref:Isoamyl acetate-hydrolyzing esterase 1 like protein n=1 Tax=Cladophialophora carrionii TaxID=86049 RepID=A0A1C1CIG2_9EURO|nr:Isoamyl acetate-hydrolyzing esterase 1 like protein [Cladophialophora carrionii]